MFTLIKGDILKISVLGGGIYYRIHGSSGVTARLSNTFFPLKKGTADNGVTGIFQDYSNATIVDYIKVVNGSLSLPVSVKFYMGTEPISSTIRIPADGFAIFTGESITIYDSVGVQIVNLPIITTGSSGPPSTAYLPEGSPNLYFTNQRAQSAVAGMNLSSFTNDTGFITNAALIPYALSSAIPTNNSQLSNGAGYLTTVPAQSWTSITGKPTAVSAFTNDAGYITTVPSQTWSSITGKPPFATVATTGLYSDLSGRPTIPSNTDQISEGSNLYFTPARAVAAVNASVIKASYSTSGTGSTLSFTIPHGLSGTPVYYNVVPTSSAASGISYITVNETGIIIRYNVAPPSGTNNLTYVFRAEL